MRHTVHVHVHVHVHGTYLYTYMYTCTVYPRGGCRFSQFSTNIPKPFHHVHVCTTVHEVAYMYMYMTNTGVHDQ